MQNTLRSLLTAVVVSAAAALASNPAMAATATANVPFSFTASGKKCPAGTYKIEMGHLNRFVSLSNASGNMNMVWVAGPGEPNPSDTRVILRFDRIGSSYALQSVQYGGAITSRLDKKTPSEQLTEILGQ